MTDDTTQVAGEAEALTAAELESLETSGEDVAVTGEPVVDETETPPEGAEEVDEIEDQVDGEQAEVAGAETPPAETAGSEQPPATTEQPPTPEPAPAAEVAPAAQVAPAAKPRKNGKKKDKGEEGVVTLEEPDPNANVSFIPASSASVPFNGHMIHFHKDVAFIAEPALFRHIVESKAFKFTLA